jgi:hypothetical protein
MPKVGRHARDAAWCQASESWMLNNGLMQVVQPQGKSLMVSD